jgi:hypothetical protein
MAFRYKVKKRRDDRCDLRGFHFDKATECHQSHQIERQAGEYWKEWKKTMCKYLIVILSTCFNREIKRETFLFRGIQVILRDTPDKVESSQAGTSKHERWFQFC